MISASVPLLSGLRGSGRSLLLRMSTLAAGQRYDLVVYGATGYTGQYVVEEIARVAEKEKDVAATLTWAIAGRSKDKLQKALDVANKETGLSMDDVGIILADVNDQDSLNKMASQSTVIINCVGPYQLYGEPVVKACVDNGSSHVDISGETQFIEAMQLKYSKQAEEAGVHIVSTCGFDSIPADIGLNYMVKNFKGELNSAEMFMTHKTRGAKAPIHTGTMESAALAISNREAIHTIRRQLFPKPLPKPKYKVAKKGMLHKNETLGLWGVSFPTDEPVVYRTQRYRYEEWNQRPIQFKQFIGLRSAFQGIGLLLGMAYFALICYFNWTRKLLLKYPEMMTAGVFKRAGADREQLKRLSFTATLIGQGWSEALLSGSDEHSEPPDSTIMVKVSGPDPGYGATSIMMVAAAMTILREKNSCTGKGGVLTPAIAFNNTNIIDRMRGRGMTFSVEENKCASKL